MCSKHTDFFLVIGFKVSMRLFILTNIWGRFGIFWCMYVKFIQYNQMSHIFLGRRRNYSQSNSWCCDVSQMCFDDITGVQKGFQWYYYKMYFTLYLTTILGYLYFTWVFPERNIALLFRYTYLAAGVTLQMNILDD